jgi:hypothetical protein
MPILEGVSPPGYEKTVERMKEHPEIDNPFALAWHMYNTGQEATTDPQRLKEACDRYQAERRDGTLLEAVSLAAQGVGWAQAVIVGRRLGQPLTIYRERPA